ncbi:glutathione S-transferase family protein [Candidatus Neomarinimicrobiota bacterium]
MYRLYGLTGSGNSYKPRLLLEHLGQPYEWIEIPSTRIAPRTPEFLAINPAGKVPVLEIEPGEYLPESNAILYYLARSTDFFPQGRLERAHVLRWMFFEQSAHEPYLAIARSIYKYYEAGHVRYDELPGLHELGYQALDVMEQHLADREFMVGQTYTIADISLFAYTHVASAGGFDLAPYTAINAWIERIRSQSGFVELG